MAREWNVRKAHIWDHAGHPCPLNDLWDLISAAGEWYARRSAENENRLLTVVGAMITLGIMVPAGEGADDGE